MKKYLCIPILFILVFLSLYSSAPSVSSSELKQVTEGDVTSFVDDNGKIRLAADKGYASVVKKYEDGKLVLEQYLDEKGEPVILPAGYAQIKRVYDDRGKNTEIFYLDENDRPVVMNNGYDTIRRTYDKKGRADTDTYWADNAQTKRTQGYWQYQRVYDESNHICELRYLDQAGNLIRNTSGYAVVHRSYDGEATIDMYFDENLNPVASDLGQYGKRTETLDNVQITTYLDEKGETHNTNRGYAIVKKEGAKTQYYDADEKPVTIGRNQFGVEQVNGQSVYLNEDGEQMMRLDNVLNTKPYLVLIFGILLTFVTLAVKGKGRAVFLIIYIFFILYMTMAYRETGDSHGEFELFRSYKAFFSSAMTRQNILNNIWLFVPFGAILGRFERKGLWIWAVALSVAIELVQLGIGIGLFEFDDILSNSIGAVIGYGLARSFRRFRFGKNKSTIKEDDMRTI
ncbi:Glycopeptide antibiotics resistance protein [[Clostridium] aminophilum]|uniref:Glycopeptide antibiotics resistance protein n=1 Tax=[Clostridium] aminophilum TaxID=1526 RepID=A0A1I0B705_9FIRM|nr:VanZ family protein [[Clostridium] aminophilum]SET02517.1 Glycopeptide antibiotics resistance protein [[Clostridium] aminophilum]